MLRTGVNTYITVRSVRQETPGYMTVVFERPRNFEYQAGDWMDLQFTSGEYSGGTTYSFSSSPTEPDLAITFRAGVSSFKSALMTAIPGERLLITQYGNAYDFYLRDNASSLLIAGGVGIAPFRSMLKQLYDEGGKSQVRLVYLHQTDDFLYKSELDIWQSAMPYLTVTYIVTGALRRSDRTKLLCQAISKPASHYYVAGPPGMVAGTTEILQEAGVARRDIRLDSFDGY